MRDKLFWRLLGLADSITNIGFSLKPGLICKTCLAIADACDAAALLVRKGGAA